jgi:RNA polymerase sigma factor (sigma-70 family)
MHDGELIQAVLAGDREAFGPLVERYQGLIYRLCYGVTGNIPDAEDLAHEALVEAYLKLHQLRDPEKFAPWLKTLALNLCRMWYRRSRREVAALIEEPVVEVEEERPDYARMFGGLSRLSAAHRLVLVLHYWEGLSYDEVATFLGVPVGTVMSRLHRARRELKRHMETMEDDEEMTAMPDEGFKQEVEAEIAVLLTMFGENADARERLSVILRRSPERFAQLIGQAPDEQTLEHLALLLRRLGRTAIEAALASTFSPDAHLRRQAATLLRRFVVTGKPGPDGMPFGRMARLESYLLLDQLLQTSVAPDAKARLLDELLEASSEERMSLLLASALLCFPEEAVPLLLHRFWGAPSPAELYRSGSALFALCRTGTRFAAALLEPLRKGGARQQALALAGAEAVARSLRCDWLDLDTAADERVALEARFRWKWAPPLKQDRDPAVLRALAACLAAFLEDDRADLRETALRTLGLLKAETYREPIEACVRHDHPGTRLAALRALADIGDTSTAPLLLEVARGGVPAEQREAVRALGRLGVAEAAPLVTSLLDHADPEVGRAAVFAVGEIGGEAARPKLQALLSQPGPLREAAARALHAGAPGARPSVKARETGRAPRRPGRMTELIRGDAQPPFYIALDAAIRALPALQSYDEGTLSRHVGRVCSDWASTRRRLIEEGLMRREGGVYRFTELGEAVWRVERFIRDQYLQ